MSEKRSRNGGPMLAQAVVVIVLAAIVGVVAVVQPGEVSHTFEEVAAQLDQAPTGQLSIDHPSELEVGEAASISLAVDPASLPIQEVTADAEQELETGVTPKMSADLVGAGFTVLPVSPRQQLVPLDRPTVWSWQVTPDNAHAERLDWSVTLLLEFGDEQVPRLGSNGVVTIDVYESFPQRAVAFMGRNLVATIMTALAIPGALVGWRQYRSGFKGTADPAEPNRETARMDEGPEDLHE